MSKLKTRCKQVGEEDDTDRYSLIRAIHSPGGTGERDEDDCKDVVVVVVVVVAAAATIRDGGTSRGCCSRTRLRHTERQLMPRRIGIDCRRHSNSFSSTSPVTSCPE